MHDEHDNNKYDNHETEKCHDRSYDRQYPDDQHDEFGPALVRDRMSKSGDGPQI
jgi:hypothetical protein